MEITLIETNVIKGWKQGRPRRRWVDNIRMDLVEVGWGDADWIGLAQDMSSSCKFRIEPSGSTKCWKAIECPNNYGSLE
jgi:hypothetical protein